MRYFAVVWSTLRIPSYRDTARCIAPVARLQKRPESYSLAIAFALNRHTSNAVGHRIASRKQFGDGSQPE